MSIFLKKYKTLLWPVILGTASIVLLLFKISARTFWMDESAVLMYLKFNPFAFLKYYFAVPDNHPPLFYFLVITFYNIFHDNELVIRLTSVLSGMGITVAVYYFSLYLFRQKELAIIAGFLTITSSYFVLISQMARYHSLAAFVCLQGFYWFYRWSEEGIKKYFYLMLIFSALTGFSDYPHFIYLELILNCWFIILFIQKKALVTFKQWFIGQMAVGISFLPMIWMMYERIVFQGDGGFNKTNLLGNGPKHLFAAFSMHIYAFFFGENIFPWDYVFIPGALILLGAFIFIIFKLAKNQLPKNLRIFFILLIVLIGLNTLFMNYADPRYNFLVYPKFGFVAFPVFIIVLAGTLFMIPKWLRYFLISIIFFINFFGLYNFYSQKNYLNASYFNTFKSYEFVRDNSKQGDYLIINGDANQGVYDFYKKKYFARLKPVEQDNVSSTIKAGERQRFWMFSTASDEGNTNNSTENKIPPGLRVVKQFDNAPLDPNLMKFKEKITHYQSYKYKYSVFLLEN